MDQFLRPSLSPSRVHAETHSHPMHALGLGHHDAMRQLPQRIARKILGPHAAPQREHGHVPARWWALILYIPAPANQSPFRLLTMVSYGHFLFFCKIIIALCDFYFYVVIICFAHFFLVPTILVEAQKPFSAR